jgi:dTDP-glucose 4,6-dehydratase
MEYQSIFISGGAGFIGSNFIRCLLQLWPSKQLVIFDKLTYAGNIENIASLCGHPQLQFIQGDICDAHAVQEAMNGCTLIVHLAAETHVDRSIADSASFMQTNIVGTYTLLEMARRLGIRRFIHVSTGEVYGNAETPDGYRRPSIEIDPTRPFSPYAASKVAAEAAVFSYWKTYGVPVVIVRCSNTYGPYQHPEKQLPLFILHALKGRSLPVYGDGHSIRDWIYVDDICSALKEILTAPSHSVVGEIFNIGAGEERSVLDNAYTILDQLNLPKSCISFVPDRLGHVRYRTLNSHKLRARLGWAPRIHFQDGIEYTINWYRNHQDWLERSTALQPALSEFSLAALTMGNSPRQTGDKGFEQKESSLDYGCRRHCRF